MPLLLIEWLSHALTVNFLAADPTAPVTEQAQETQQSEQTPVSTAQPVQETQSQQAGGANLSPAAITAELQNGTQHAGQTPMADPPGGSGGSAFFHQEPSQTQTVRDARAQDLQQVSSQTKQPDSLDQGGLPS